MFAVKREFDVIVVGGGPAGLSAAYTTSKKGLRTILFERGEYPGAKNLFGGIVHACWPEETLPSFLQEAPVERQITQYNFSLVSGESMSTFSFKSSELGASGGKSFTVSRPLFDRWFAEQVKSAGALIVAETVVDDLIMDRGRVLGVVARRASGEVRANVTIAADGALSLISQKLGLRRELDVEDFSLGAKEVLSLPAPAIGERFNLKGDEGLAHLFIGAPTRQIPGAAFLYTNKESLSIGIVAKIKHLRSANLKIYDLLDDFKKTSAINGPIKGGRLREYGAKIIPDAGPKNGQRLNCDGLLVAGDAGGFVLSNGLNIRGFDLAVASGCAAGKAAVLAHEKGNFSSKQMSLYTDELSKMPPAGDYAGYKRAAAFTANLNLYQHYPDLVCDVFKSLLTMEAKPRAKLTRILKSAMRDRISWAGMIRDLVQLLRAV